MTRPVFRFAPSPNGALHLGHALSALTGFEMARRTGGRFLLRIEDIDVTRARREFVLGIFEDLSWLGLSWEEPVLFQSQHFDDYKRAALALDQMGVLYPCFASRSEIMEAGDAARLDPEGSVLYPGLWRGRPASDVAAARERNLPFALRIDVARALALAHHRLGGEDLAFTEFDDTGTARRVIADPARWGDFVILRKDVPASYMIAVVVDDARQGVTHVTRGMDLFAATDAQRLLHVLLGLPEPLYHHHRLIEDAFGRKLSKSLRDTSLAALRAGGATPQDIRRMVGLAP